MQQIKFILYAPTKHLCIISQAKKDPLHNHKINFTDVVGTGDELLQIYEYLPTIIFII